MHISLTIPLCAQVPLPSGVSGAKEARPRLVTLVVLKGSAEELDLPASDYWNVVTENSAHDWYVRQLWLKETKTGP